MSWGTYYKHEGYLSHIYKNEVEEKIEEYEEDRERLYETLLSYMSQTPPAVYKEGDYECPYAEFLVSKLKEIREELEEAQNMLCRLYECREVMRESPSDVSEG